MTELSELLSGALEEDTTLFTSGVEEKKRVGVDDAFASKQAAMSAIMNNADIVGDFRRVKSELVNRGMSEDIERFTALTQNELAEDDAVIVSSIVTNDGLGIDDKAVMLRNLDQDIKDRRPLTLQEVFIRQQSLGAITNTPSESSTQNNTVNNMARINLANQEIEDIKLEFALEFNDSVASVGTDFIVSALAPGFGVKIAQIVEEVIPGKASAFYNITPGEALKLWKVEFKDASPEDRVMMAKKLLPVIRDVANIGFANDFEAWDIMETFLGDINPDDAAIEFDRWLINAVGVLDLVPVLGAAGLLVKNVVQKVKKGSVANNIASTAPINADELLTGALKSEADEVSTSMGTTKSEILNTWAMPKHSLDSVPVGPDLNRNIGSEALERNVGVEGHTVNYTPFERYNAADRELSRIEEIEKSTFRELLSKTRVESIPGGFNVRTVLGQSEDYGFASADDALDGTADVALELPDAKVTILRRDYDKGELVEEDLATARAGGQGEYYLQIEQKHIYNPDDVIGGELTDVVIGVTGPLAKYLDKSSVFSRWIGQSGNVAALQTSFAAKQLTRVMKPFNSLASTSKAKVLALLDEGGAHVDTQTSQVGKWFSQDELASRFDGDKTLVKAYNSVKTHQDRVYDIQNNKLKSTLARKGMKSVINTTTGWERIARPLSLDEALTETHALDPLTENMRFLDTQQVEAIYEEGGSLARMAGDEIVDNDITDLVVISNKDKTNYGNLPEYVLNKRDGYITTIYDTTHIIKKKMTGVKKNGELITPRPGSTFNGQSLVAGEILVTTKMASNSGEALRAARRLNQNADEGSEYGVVEARELNDIDYANQASYDFYRDKGQLYFSKRGNEIENISGHRGLSSVIEAIEAARLSAARHVGMDDFLDSQTARWEKKWGSQFGIGEEGSKRMPLDGKLPLGPNASLPEKAAHRDATALRDHIAMVSGVDNTVMRRYGRSLSVWVAEKLAGAGDGRFIRAREAAAEGVLRGRDRNVLDGLKSLAFLRFIVLSPARQLFLQSQQATVMLGLEHGGKYFSSGKGVRDWTGLTMGMGAIDNPKVWKLLAPTAAKGMGMSIKEYTDLIGGFRRSGIPDDLDSHSFINMLSLDSRSAIDENSLLRGGKHLLNGARGVARLSRTIGFDAGEYVNLSAAFLAVRNKWILNNPGKNWLDDDNLAVIGGETREVTFNMNRAGTLAWQKGTAGVMFQFMSHAAKSLQVLIPDTKFLGLGKLSNKAFTNKERLRIALLQAGIYGTGGYGLNATWSSFRDSLGVVLPEEVNSAIEEGIAGTTLSALFHSVDVEGEDTTLEFSSSFGPFSGGPKATPIAKVLPEIVDALMMNQPDYRQITPAGFSALAEVVEAVKFSNLVLGSSIDIPDEVTPHKAVIIFNEALTLAPVYSNWMKGKAARATGAFATKTGNPTVRASAGEILAKQLFGVRSKKEVAVQEEIFRLLGRDAELEKSPDTQLTETGTILYKRLLKFTRQLHGGDMNEETFQKLLTQEHTMLKFSLDEAEYNRVMEVAQNKMFSQFNEGGEVMLTSLLYKFLARGSLGNLEGRATTRIKNMPDFDGKQEVLKWIDNMLDSQQVVEGDSN